MPENHGGTNETHSSPYTVQPKRVITNTNG